MSSTMPALGVVLASALLLTGCSGDDDGDADRRTSSSPSPQPPASPTDEASPVDVPNAPCAVRSHVPGERVTLQSVKAVAVYANAYTLAPGTSTTSEREMLGAYDLTPISVTAKGAEVPAAVRRAVLGSNLGRWPASGPPDEDGPHRVTVRNDSDESRQYVVYRGGETRRGTWATKLCGAPYNDGTRVERLAGRFSTLSRPLTKVRTYVCGSGPQDDYERAASRVCGA
ncbi:hypothetical protein [Nocardioides lijunqiniae]|uniref:hypothetical protein n=1 Tax=Nocardioides lijunqiniae TaxID=2760832 RepID=UPI001877CEA2|nr:hypothetical protein [Nocardioides lijunqiniae]